MKGHRNARQILFVESDVALEEQVADLIARGYVLMNHTPRRATLVRPRAGRLLSVFMILCCMVGCLFFIGASTARDSG